MFPIIAHGPLSTSCFYGTQCGILLASMIIDISRPIHDKMAIYPNNPDVIVRRIREAAPGVTALSEISFGSHTGTHIDTPAHVYPGGAGAESYSLGQCVGEAQVVEISNQVESISAKDIPSTTASRVILKTKNSQGDINVFDSDFVALSEDGAREIIRRGITCIGIDGFSIKKRGVSDTVHEMLLDAGIMIIEGLWLPSVAPGMYKLICLPLPLFHADGVPARAVLDSLS